MAVTQQPRRAKTQPGPGYPTLILNGVPAVEQASPVSLLPSLPGYEIVSQIDQGGMSNIYLARQKGLERLVVLKMIRPQDSLDANLRKRFILEASSIARLQHPNVVQIHEIGEADGMPYLCLEYIAGGNLERKIRERLPTPRASADIVRQLAEAIQAAHDQQIIHRDLKPSNVLCELVEPAPGQAHANDWNQMQPGRRIHVKLTDFGLARILCETSDQTKSGYAIGTPSFMSPEQASGRPEDIGKSTDIYGLGAILYELLTGDPPFEGETATETIRQVRLEAPIPPSQRNLAVPRDLERICLQCLEKLPENRYANARDLANDLRRFLEGRSVAAHPVGPVRKWWRRCRRHPLYSLALLSAAVLAIITWLSLFLLNRAHQELKTKDLQIEQVKANVGAPDSPPVPPEFPHDVQNALDRIHQDPTSTDHAQQLANLGDEWLERLSARFPEDFAVRLGVGEAQLLRKHIDEALSSFERARRIAEEQTNRGDVGTESYARLAQAHERIGDIHLLKNDLKTACRDYDRAIAQQEMLHQDDPQEQRWALALAAVCGKQAEVYAQEKDWPNALGFYGRCLGLLIRLFPNVPALGAEIRETHERMAELNGKLGNSKAREYHLKEAEKFQKGSP